MDLNQRPATGEYGEYYARYVNLVDPGDKDIVTHLKAQGMVVLDFMRKLGEDDGVYRYAEGKWTVNELTGHLIDMERLFAFRALWIARGDKQEQPGVDEGFWSSSSNAGQRTLAGLRREQHVCRTDHIYLLRSFCERAWERRGLVDGHGMSLRAVPWIICGHELHHMRVLKKHYGMDIAL